MITKLISMTEFVLNITQSTDHKELDNEGMTNEKMIIYLSSLMVIDNYAKFLSLPLKLEMFIPCDDGNLPLSDPCQYNTYCYNFCQGSCSGDYDEAKEKVLFEGFKMCDRTGSGCVTNDNEHVLLSISLGRPIEFLAGRDLTLTDTAKKMIYG